MPERAFSQNSLFAQTRKIYRSAFIIRLTVFAFGSFLILFLNHIDPTALFKWRGHLNDGAVSGLHKLEVPFSVLEKKVRELRNLAAYFEHREKLEVQLNELEHWRHRTRRLRYENRKLKESLRYIKRDLPVVATTRAFFNHEGRYLQSMTLDAGETEGVRMNQPVLAYGRLIGRVIEVSPHSSRVLLITDMQSRTPVETEWSQLRGILSGNNSFILTFLHEREKKNMLEGELVYSTGEGGIFPAGSLIGKISLDRMGDIYVDPGIDWRKIDVVQLLEAACHTDTDVNENRN